MWSTYYKDQPISDETVKGLVYKLKTAILCDTENPNEDKLLPRSLAELHNIPIGEMHAC